MIEVSEETKERVKSGHSDEVAWSDLQRLQAAAREDSFKQEPLRSFDSIVSQIEASGKSAGWSRAMDVEVKFNKDKLHSRKVQALSEG